MTIPDRRLHTSADSGGSGDVLILTVCETRLFGVDTQRIPTYIPYVAIIGIWRRGIKSTAQTNIKSVFSQSPSCCTLALAWPKYLIDDRYCDASERKVMN